MPHRFRRAAVLGPLLGQVEPDIDQGVLVVRGVGHEDADLAVVDLAEPPEPLPLHARRGVALLGEARGVEDDHAVGGADRPAHLAGQLAQQRPVVPGGRADEVLQAVPLLVVAVGDGLGVLVLQVGDEPGRGRSGRGPAAPGVPGTRRRAGRTRRGVRCRPGRPPGGPRTRRATAACGAGNASASVTSVRDSSSPEGSRTSIPWPLSTISDSRTTGRRVVNDLSGVERLDGRRAQGLVDIIDAHERFLPGLRCRPTPAA